MAVHEVKAQPAVETVTLRAATMKDAEALALVGGATFLEAFTWMLPGADLVAHCVKHHTAEAYRAYLAGPATRVTLAMTGVGEAPAAPVGYLMLVEPELPSIEVRPTDIEVKRIYLFSRFRTAPVEGAPGLRPAQAMLNAAEQNARTMGRTRLLLGTHAGNERAIAFYRRNGFAEVGTRTFTVGTQVCSDLIFGKDLAGDMQAAG